MFLMSAIEQDRSEMSENQNVVFRPYDDSLRFIVSPRKVAMEWLSKPERKLCDECYDMDPAATVQVFENDINEYPTALVLCRACRKHEEEWSKR
jgi:hypothetical protein